MGGMSLHMFADLIPMIGYLKNPDTILFQLPLEKRRWTRTSAPTVM